MMSLTLGLNILVDSEVIVGSWRDWQAHTDAGQSYKPRLL